MNRLYLLMLIPFIGTAEAKNWTREELLDYTNRSPLYVDAHNKEGWVELFTENSFIEDPVGGHHFTPKQIPFFWDAFIAKNNIKFNITRDIVSGMSVVRDAVVDAYLPTVDAHVLTPAHLRYDLMEVQGELRVKSLRAYWNMPAVTKDTLSRGPIGRQIMSTQLATTMNALGYKLGLTHFMKASLLGVGNRGQKTVNKMITGLNNGNKKAFLKKFHTNAKIVFNGDQSVYRPSDLITQQFKFQAVNKIISAGNSVGFNAVVLDDQRAIRPALVIVNFKRLKVQNIEIFTESR